MERCVSEEIVALGQWWSETLKFGIQRGDEGENATKDRVIEQFSNDCRKQLRDCDC